MAMKRYRWRLSEACVPFPTCIVIGSPLIPVRPEHWPHWTFWDCPGCARRSFTSGEAGEERRETT
jgi:hypothetical protein